MRNLLEDIFKTYYKDIYAYLYSLSRDASLSEDLTGEVFLEVVKSIGSFRREADIKTWMFSIARHRWFAYLKKQKRQVKIEELSEFYQSSDFSIEERYQHKTFADRFYIILSNEPERTKNIVLMRIDGYSFYEIGQRYGISENSARVIYFRTKTKIREMLKKEGLGLE